MFGLLAAVLVLGATAAGTPASARSHHGHRGNAFTQRNLVSDIPGLAELTDSNVVNPWGIAFGLGANATPLWVNNNGASDPTQAIQLYKGATTATDPVVKVGLQVAASVPFGLVFNPTTDFKIDQGAGPTPARFLFTELLDPNALEGGITGWANQVIPPATTPPVTTTPTDARKAPSLPFGLALVPGRTGHDEHGRSRHDKGDRGNRLLVADGLTGTVDVYDAAFQPVTGPGLFVDPTIADVGFVPYNVAFLKNRVYVAYADANGGPGGAISVFKADGRFQKRLATNGAVGTLQGPWGMAIAPEHWGKFGGRLLVGNVGDGTINVFGRRSGQFKGTVSDASGAPLVNSGLWGIAFGNGVIGTPRTLVFAAGIGNEVNDVTHEYEHGLIGLISPVRAKHHH
ncbi:MAG: TIGR03118 family protein [Marmoricola sp.]